MSSCQNQSEEKSRDFDSFPFSSESNFLSSLSFFLRSCIIIICEEYRYQSHWHFTSFLRPSFFHFFSGQINNFTVDASETKSVSFLLLISNQIPAAFLLISYCHEKLSSMMRNRIKKPTYMKNISKLISRLIRRKRLPKCAAFTQSRYFIRKSDSYHWGCHYYSLYWRSSWHDDH